MPFDPVLAWASLPRMLHGMLNTVGITALSLVFGLAIAIPITLARMSPRPSLNLPAAAFVMFFRGTPAIILLYLVYYGLAQLPSIHDGPLWLIFANAFACAVIGLTLNHASYLVEILRGGLDAVPAGLTEASAALGISPRQTFTWIRFPLAMRYALKAYQNEVLMFTKGTAVVGVVTVVDLTAVANEVFEATYDAVTPMLAAAVLYWVLINLMRIGFELLDRSLNRHLIADERRRRKPGTSASRTLLSRWTSLSTSSTEQAPGTEQAR
jgi:His/Glu/Gln/Arg/opine family amino acid ABC transporter permease subunit